MPKGTDGNDGRHGTGRVAQEFSCRGRLQSPARSIDIDDPGNQAGELNRVASGSEGPGRHHAERAR